MYIEPNTTVKIFRGVPLDEKYEHTIKFNTRALQNSYFATKVKYTLTNQSYQRVQKGKMRVQLKAEDLYDCNYLAFNNASFGAKWFYAFIKNVEYVNNVTSEIEFAIDVMQTWLPGIDYQFEQCFIEREHPTTDNPGDNTVPENVELGEYVSDGLFTTANVMENLSVIVAATFDQNYNDFSGGAYSGLFSGLCFNEFPGANDRTQSGITAAVNFIAGAGAKSDGIVAVFMMPSVFVSGARGSGTIVNYSRPKITSGAIGSGDEAYTPKNKKLYTYPYNFLYCTNGQGNSASYPYEYFGGTTCQFELFGDTSANPSVILTPINYKGSGTTSPNFDEKMVLSGFPQLPFNTDTFKAWLAQNAASLGVNALSTVASGLVRAAVSPVSGALTAAAGIANTIATVYEHSIMPNQARGGSGSSVLLAHDLLQFFFMHKHCRKEYLRIIDNYFSLYGYAIHRVKYPEIDSRPFWNYVKTIGCQIQGYLPADDMQKIVDIYDAGVTFWHNTAYIGDYTQDNSPV